MVAYDFAVKDKETKEILLRALNVLAPINTSYLLGFICFLLDSGQHEIRIYLEIVNGDATCIYRKQYTGGDPDKIKKLLIESTDQYWNYALSHYREKEGNKKVVNSEEDIYISKLKSTIQPIHARKYAKKYSYKERRELRKLGYYDFDDSCLTYSTFDYLLTKASNREKMSFEKLKLITLGYKEYIRGISPNVLYYSEYFLSADVIEKIHELTLLDSNTSTKLIDIKKMVEEERMEFNRICEITANKKQENINTILEAEKIKYMISNGMSLQEAFYYIDKEAQQMKKDILDCYLSIENKQTKLNFSEKIIKIANYLCENVQKRNIETVVDGILINDDALDTSNYSDEVLNDISFLKLTLRGDKNVEN